ncbi:MAG: Dabb family protein [Opitutales bacterium]|nr:Dabb family protein [Opitutales bacterium]
MIRHIVFFRMKGGGAEEIRRNALELKARLEALPPLIPQIQHLECGLDVVRSEASYDLSLTVDVHDLSALEAYRVHPAHQKVVAFVKEVTTARAVVDYEVA